MTQTYDAVVVGAGLLGLAAAHEMLRRHPGAAVAVVEKEDRVCSHQSGHNSGVVHSGVYYRPGSLKATLCLRGKRMLEEFVSEHGIGFRRCGKVIVAVRREELGLLQEILARGEANGVDGIRAVSRSELEAIEPNVRGIRALHLPSTGIVDFEGVGQALAGAVRSGGGEIFLETTVLSVASGGGTHTVRSDRGPFRARRVLVCSGLQSDRVGRSTTDRKRVRIVPIRGSYYNLSAERAGEIRGLVYPVPDPELPFLGVHLTPRLNGDVVVGPNAVLAFARETYARWGLHAADTADFLRFAGFWRMARRHWRVAAKELPADVSIRRAARQAGAYLPSIRPRDLSPGPIGIRAQAVTREGRLVDDFVVEASDGRVHVINAPSPAATACLAIAEHVVDRYLS